MPEKQHRFKQWIDLSFLTIHRSKGSEADYVILPAMVSMLKKGLSFPNNRTDDSVLGLAMPDGDNFPLGEERRLFYVALTRARRSAVMFTVRGQTSPFIQELAIDSGIVITDLAGNQVKEQQCPACKQGILTLRTGPYGRFLSCSNYPQCCFKPPKSRHATLEGLKRPSKANTYRGDISA